MRRAIYEDDVIKLLDKGWKTGVYPVASNIHALPSAQSEHALKDCRNCKYGKYNDHWDTYFCYNSDNCEDWNLWESDIIPSAQSERKMCNLCKYYEGVHRVQGHAHAVFGKLVVLCMMTIAVDGRNLMDDLISRQAAIDCEYQVKIINDIEYVMLSEVQMKMRKLPSAQLEIITCNQCVYYQQNHHYCEYLDTEFSPSDYCSMAERREE